MLECVNRLTETKKWEKVEDRGVKIILKKFIHGKEVVSIVELEELLGRSKKTITRNINDGMPIHPEATTYFKFFELDEVMKWRKRNVDATMSATAKAKTTKGMPRLTPQVESPEPPPDLELLDDVARKQKADADDAELKVKLNAIKLAEAEGRVVDANDLDKSMAELAIIHKTDKINDENLLPVLLENKDAGEIKQLLREHNFERLEMLTKLVNKEFKCKETLYDVVEVVLQQLKDGVEPSELIKRVKGE